MTNSKNCVCAEKVVRDLEFDPLFRYFAILLWISKFLYGNGRVATEVKDVCRRLNLTKMAITQ